MAIQPIELKHLNLVADIHIRAFPKSALTHLGKETICRYYEWQLDGPHDCLAIGVFDQDNQLKGFCIGGIFRGSLSGFVSKNKKYLIIQVLKRPWLIFTNPLFRDRLRLGLRVSKNSPSPANYAKKFAAKNFGILSIAVDPNAQGQGIGRQLMEYSESFARSNGFVKMNLTVAIDNNQAIRFYEHNGWAKVIGNSDWKGSMEKIL